MLENNQQLAFLHGASAQIVYALIAAQVVMCSPSYERAEPSGTDRKQRDALRALPWLSLAALGAVYAQIVLGAWLRHSGSHLPLALHVVGALGAAAMVLWLVRQLRAASAGSESSDAPDADSGRGPLRTTARWLLGCLLAQVALGLLATFAIFEVSGGFESAPRDVRGRDGHDARRRRRPAAVRLRRGRAVRAPSLVVL